MKVTGIKVTPVTVPMEAPLRWSMGLEVATTRAIIEVSTDEGITGIGETYGGNAIEHSDQTGVNFGGTDPRTDGEAIPEQPPF